MASPPFRSGSATSPQLYAPSIPPSGKKRPSLSPLIPPSSQSSSLNKRRRTSLAHSVTSANHPLRQTSFPEDDDFSFSARVATRSPSLADDQQSVATSLTGAGSTRGRSRGRKSKAKDKDGSSIASGKKGAAAEAEAAEAEDEEEEDDQDLGLVNAEGVNEDKEKENLAVLIDNFNSDQADRYELYIRGRLKKETVRKIANQTLSQSVPVAVVNTISGYSKIFIGELIERAREVQAQWESLQFSGVNELPPDPVSSTTSSQQQQQKSQFTQPTTPTANSFLQASQSQSMPTTSPSSTIPDSPCTQKKKQETMEAQKEKERGPLLPEHLREALRRYRKAGEGGGVGFTGLSLALGVNGSGTARLNGKRLFG